MSLTFTDIFCGAGGTMQAGNAVSANVAHWLGCGIAAVL